MLTQADMRNKIICGDALDVLRTMPDECVDCCVTSPPYWGLRDYGVDGQIGLEPTLDEFTARLTQVFHEVKRVLKPDGTLFLNMGDAYATAPAGNFSKERQAFAGGGGRYKSNKPKIQYGKLKQKDLIGQPWLLAFALRADGWYLRSDIIWSKKNPMPESVTDRPTKSHEYVFLMSKQPRYFYDADAVREGAPNNKNRHYRSGKYAFGITNKANDDRNFTTELEGHGEAVTSRNKRTVWTIATQPMPDAHFATFPEKLVEPCILAGTSEKGYCSECGKAWGRVVEVSAEYKARLSSRPNAEGLDKARLAAYLKDNRCQRGLSQKDVARHFPSITGGVTGACGIGKTARISQQKKSGKS